MNKITKLFGIIAIAASTMLVACKGETGEIGPKGEKGETGKTGENGKDGKDGVDGKDGKDGAANIQSYTFTARVADWKETNIGSVGTGATSKWGVASYSNPAITTSKFVEVYVRTSDSFRRALPIDDILSVNNSVENVEFRFETGRIDIMYKLQTQLFGGAVYYAPVKDITFEILLIDKTIFASMKEKNIDIKNYDAVMSFVNHLK